MFRHQTVAWSTPLPFAKQQAISYNVASHYGHLKPLSVEDLAITDISEISGRDLPTQVIKHTAAEYVELFRDQGILKLGTFREYRESDDPANQDSTEGQLMVWVKQSDFTYNDVGGADDRFKIFCTSLNSNKTTETSGYGDSKYVIEDLQGFFRAIAQTTGMVPLALSSCLYRNSRVLQVEDKKTTGPPNPLEPTTKIHRHAQIGLSFIKPDGHKQHEEFRFLWHDRNKSIPASGIIRCPDARKFCSFT
jgi:hypothetical protein